VQAASYGAQKAREDGFARGKGQMSATMKYFLCSSLARKIDETLCKYNSEMNIYQYFINICMIFFCKSKNLLIIIHQYFMNI